MLQSWLKLMDRLFAPVPGWLFLLSGLTLLALTAIVPAWVEWQDLKARMELMRGQESALAAQVRDYRQFDQSLAGGDSTVLERVAYYYLRLKPAGAAPLLTYAHDQVQPSQGGIRSNHLLSAASTGASGPGPSVTIEQMLHKSLPDQLEAQRQAMPPNTRLVRLTTSRLRWGLIASGLFCLLGGLFWVSPKPET